MRKLIFPLLSKFDFRFTIKHHYTTRNFTLKFWSHKGYWFYGAAREKKEISNFFELLKEDEVIFEIGGHIGYITQIFEQIVGEKGKVLVAEPTPESINLLRKNKLKSTILVDKAVSDCIGVRKFYTEKFGGFTNSLNKEFTENTTNTFSKYQGIKYDQINETLVETISIDEIVKISKLTPTFLKIDVEGAELDVLKGAKDTLKNVRGLMVEVTCNKEEVFDFLTGYSLIPIYTPEGQVLSLNGNVFFLKQGMH